MAGREPRVEIDLKKSCRDFESFNDRLFLPEVFDSWIVAWNINEETPVGRL